MRGWRRGTGAAVALAIAAALPAASAARQLGPVAEATGRPHSAGKPYAARGLPDRVVLTPGADPSREMAVAFRTDARQGEALAELAPAIDGPSVAAAARRLAGRSADIATENGAARYHQVRFDGLEPDTPYLYRVRGADGWSEWYQFRTAAAAPRPFTFLYFGDTQNDILEIGSRVIRQAFQSTPLPALVLHAGDLVAQREEKVHDDEWGEWAQAGGHHYAMVPQVPAAGNHEYVDHVLPSGAESRRLGPHWPLSFALPGNGVAPAERTTYFIDHQGARFIILDGTAALDLGALDAQTRWLDETLASSRARWNVVLFHQPIFTCARPNDTEVLKAAWQPIFEARRVDLVLQGHDHCYARLTSVQGREASARAHAAGDPQGPVYLVSVVGSKMYGLNDRALTQPDRVAEETHLWQRFDVEEDRILFRAYTPSGRLYDGFELRRGGDGRNRLSPLPDAFGPIRRCEGGRGPDGHPCTARPR
ncbi:MAG: fibronectin type III domain-containing protein [Allosphingosinicella sp.]|uniref:fibronectin type III domain-containing protein n=1 Tax=Allosphingosinicella sp. TaxID=2823234 RepID=UPI00392BDBE8